MTKQYRWVCPQCGTGANAPSRLTTMDTRRYCLECSANSKRLVIRTAPSLDRVRAVRSQRTKVKRVAKVTRLRDKQYVINGIDAEKLMRRVALLPIYGGRKGMVYQQIKAGAYKLIVHRCSKMQSTKVGQCFTDACHLYAWPEINEAAIREILIHELMHLSKYITYWKCDRRCRIGHCRHFVAKLKIADRQANRRLGSIDGAVPLGSRRHYLANMPVPRCEAVEGSRIVPDEAA